MFKKLLAATALSAALLGAPAMAQSNSFGGTQVRQNVSLQQVATLLQQQGLQVQPLQSPDGSTALGVITPGGGRFIVIPRECSNPAASAGCELLEIFTRFPQTVSLSRINQFHSSTSLLSFAVAGSDFTIVATKAFTVGGVTDQHILFTFAAFLRDVDSFTRTSLSGAAQAVSYDADFPPISGGVVNGADAEAIAARFPMMKESVSAIDASFDVPGLSDMVADLN